MFKKSGSYLHTRWDFGGSDYQGFHFTSTPPFSQSMGGMKVEKMRDYTVSSLTKPSLNFNQWDVVGGG